MSMVDVYDDQSPLNFKKKKIKGENEYKRYRLEF